MEQDPPSIPFIWHHTENTYDKVHGAFEQGSKKKYRKCVRNCTQLLVPKTLHLALISLFSIGFAEPLYARLCLRLLKRGRLRKTAGVTGLHELAQPVTPAVMVRSSEYFRERLTPCVTGVRGHELVQHASSSADGKSLRPSQRCASEYNACVGVSVGCASFFDSFAVRHKPWPQYVNYALIWTKA